MGRVRLKDRYGLEFGCADRGRHAMNGGSALGEVGGVGERAGGGRSSQARDDRG